MTAAAVRPFVSVKFAPAGRTQTFLLPELALDALADSETPAPAAVAPLSVGDAVVVQAAEGPAVGTVVRGIPQLEARRRGMADAASSSASRRPIASAS